MISARCSAIAKRMETVILRMVTNHFLVASISLFMLADMCGWKNILASSDYKRVLWLRIRPQSLYIKGTFMHYDHTTGSSLGNYLVWPLQMQGHSYSVLKSPLL